MRLVTIGALSACMFMVAGCSLDARGHCRASEEEAAVDSLYFGTSRAAGALTSEEWRQFLAQFITPRFPAGTAWEAAGQWRNAAGGNSEGAIALLHLVHPDTTENEQTINDVINAYKSQFCRSQEAFNKASDLPSCRKPAQLSRT